MDEDAGFDSVQWDRTEQIPTSPQSHPPHPFQPETTLPHRRSSHHRQNSTSSTDRPQAGDHADHADLPGIDKDGELNCIVDAPQKENDGTKDAYVSYRITTQSDFSSFMKRTFTVRRRFTDFVFLRTTLYREYISIAVPPLPDKNNLAYVRGDRFGTEFTQRRAWSLHRFISRLTQHPVLRRAPIFLLFLESADWNAQMKNRPITRSNTMDGNSVQSNVQPAQGFFDNVADTMLNAFTKPSRPDKRFTEVHERLSKLDEDLNHVEKIVARVVRRESDLEQDYAELAVNMRKLTVLEPGVEEPTMKFAASVEETSRGWKALKDHTDQNYLGSLRDMDAYIGSVKSLLKTREQKQLDFEALSEYLQRSNQERDALVSQGGYHSTSLNPATFIRHKVEDIRGVDHETARKERARKLEVRIVELEREVNTSKGVSEMFDAQVVREVEDFERIKGLEFKDTLSALTSKNVDFYRGVVDTWERFLSEVDHGDTVLKGKAVAAG